MLQDLLGAVYSFFVLAYTQTLRRTVSALRQGGYTGFCASTGGLSCIQLCDRGALRYRPVTPRVLWWIRVSSLSLLLAPGSLHATSTQPVPVPLVITVLSLRVLIFPGATPPQFFPQGGCRSHTQVATGLERRRFLGHYLNLYSSLHRGAQFLCARSLLHFPSR